MNTTNNIFRPMRRINQQLSQSEIEELLLTEKRGVLAVFGENGYPYAVPMNFIYDNGKIYFHCAKEGHKLDAISLNSKVSFCVINKGTQDGDWYFYVKSVIIFGQIKKLESNKKTMKILKNLGDKYFPTTQLTEETMAKHSHKVQMLELTIDHITGKLVKEK